ncbi:MAG: putative peroxidase-related enzyme [Crocinitomix sp.]|jgi:uncharacterized peroxidase-related enzyme
MRTFEVPTRGEVNEVNQSIFDDLKGQLGFVPNLYAAYAYSDNALKNYLTLNSAKTSLNNKEKEAINLAVSEVNGCGYCLSAHTAIAKSNGFSGSEILELRAGKASFDHKLNALALFAKHSVETRGKVSDEVKEFFFEAGFTIENLVDTIVLIGDKTISNYLNNTTEIPIDFPKVQSLELVH